ncbi:uncharacterized protein [Solanum lycopersicum]|nr:uncharacterized protein LOC112940373 [Solanum lycopersicum]XP_025884217.1 uncharacterized protein LOC112940373 [Solanum lycopersicum]
MPSRHFCIKRMEPLEEVHYWYRKEAYLLTYKHKLQPVRGSQFWKVDPAQAMEPPEMVKLVGRPKMKRNRETDEASLRKGAWKQSRKGTLMRCNKCGDFNHNAKGCYKDHEEGESSHEINKKASSQESRSRAGKNSTCSATIVYEIEASPQHFQTQHSTAYGPEIGNEEDPTLRPMVISETETRMEKRSRIFEGIRSRKIVFKGDARGISTPLDLPYSPKKTTWKGKKAVTTGQLQAEVKKKRVKQMAMKGKQPVDTNDDLV